MANKAHSQSLSDLNIADKQVKEWINDVNQNLSLLKDEAILDLDILTEQRVDQLSILFKNLSIELSNDLDNKLSSLDLSIQKYIYSIQDILNQGVEGIKIGIDDLDLILNSNLTELCDNLKNFICPDSKINYSIKYIRGVTIEYSPSKPEYYLEIGGNAITQNSEVYLKINGKRINASNFNNTNKANKANFELPTSILANSFQDTVYERIDADIYVLKKKLINDRNPFKRKRTITDTITVPFKLFLLPKFPVAYKIIEEIKEPIWKPCPECIKEKTLNMRRGILDNYVEFLFDDNQKYSKLIGYKIDNRTTPWRKSTRQDEYFCICNTNPQMSNQGKTVKFNCRGGRISNQFVYDKPPLFLNKLEIMMKDNPAALFKDPAPFPIQTQFTSETVRFTVEYMKKDMIFSKKKIFIVESSTSNHILKQYASKGYLTYGNHFSQNLEKIHNTWTIYLYPTIYKNRFEKLILSSANNNGKIEKIANINVREEKFRDTKRLIIKIDKPAY